MPRHRYRSDEEILAHAPSMGLLAAIAAGRVTRDGPGGFWEPYLLDGVELSRLRLRWLYREDLIEMPMGGRPTVGARGWLLLGDGGFRA